MADKTPNLNNVHPELHSVVEMGYNFDFGKYFERGFKLLQNEASNLLMLSGAIWLLSLGMQLVFSDFAEGIQAAQANGDFSMMLELLQAEGPFFGLIMGAVGLLQLPLQAGFYIYLKKATFGEERSINDLLGGFNYFGPLLIMSIIMSILMILSVITLFIGGIYLGIAWSFATMVIVLHNGGVWESMETSRKIIHDKWFHLFALTLILGLLSGLASFVPYQLGMLFSVPVIACVMYAAFEDIVYIQHENGYDSRLDEIGRDDEF
ncbi:MAG: hypothetical protein AAFW00_06810 [Bacteroidota bacterium]